MARKGSRARGALEQEVLACLAAARRPLTAAQVQAELDDDLAYTTVMTTLSRLYAKHALQRSPAGRAFAYTLAGGTRGAQSNMTAHQMLKLLDGQPDRAGVLSRFVGALDAKDEQLLIRLLEQAAEPPAPAPRKGGRGTTG